MGSATPASRSTSRSLPSRLPRSRRSGQAPSWTPGTATTSHSRPRAACAVSSSTASRRGVRSASESPGSCCSARYSVKVAMSAPGSRSAKRAAASKRARTASRSRSAAAPTGPPRALASLQRRSSPQACHTRQSTSSALSPARAASPAIASSAPTRRSGAVSWAGRASSGSGAPRRGRPQGFRPAADHSRPARPQRKWALRADRRRPPPMTTRPLRSRPTARAGGRLHPPTARNAHSARLGSGWSLLGIPPSRGRPHHIGMRRWPARVRRRLPRFCVWVVRRSYFHRSKGRSQINDCLVLFDDHVRQFNLNLPESWIQVTDKCPYRDKDAIG